MTTTRNPYKTYIPVRRLLLALVLLATVVAVGTAGFVVIEKSSIIDSLYMTLITISTLGMRATADADISQAGQLWVMLLIN